MFKLYIRLFVALSLMGLGQFVFAADAYLWSASPQCKSSSPSVAMLCEAKRQVGPTGRYDGVVVLSPVMWQFKIYSTGPSVVSNPYLTRTGSICDSPDHTYDDQTGECKAPEPDKCEPTIGQRIGHWHNFGTLGANANEAPITVCESSCQYSNTFEDPKCDRNFPDKVFCSLTYLGNGVECTEGDSSNPSNFDQPPTKPPETREPTREHEQKCDQWVTSADGVARRTCTSKDEYKDPGELKCENTNGYLKCSPGSPAPDYKKTDKTTDQESKTNFDGSSNSDTTTKTDTTTCKGAKPCSTSSSETTDKTTTNPDGTPGDKSSSCKGDGCGSGIEDGEEDGKGDDEDEEEGPGLCEGSSCGQLVKGEKGSFDDFNAEYDQLIEQTEADISTYKDRFQQLADGAISTNLTGSSSLPDWSFVVFGQTYTISLGLFSSELAVFSKALLFIVAVICLFIIFGGSKESS